MDKPLKKLFSCLRYLNIFPYSTLFVASNATFAPRHFFCNNCCALLSCVKQFLFECRKTKDLRNIFYFFLHIFYIFSHLLHLWKMNLNCKLLHLKACEDFFLNIFFFHILCWMEEGMNEQMNVFRSWGFFIYLYISLY